MDLEQIAKIITEKYNTQKLDDFSGFTPSEMHQIIYDPFSPDCPIRTYIDFDPDHLNFSPIYKITCSLLNKTYQSGKIKLTAKGNLPGKILKSIYEEKIFPDNLIEKGVFKLRTERDWTILHTVHIVIKLAGLARKQHGYLLLTKKGKKLLDPEYDSSLFSQLLETYSMKFNWAYNDRYAIVYIGQIGFLYLLYLIKKYGTQYKPITFYIKKYFLAFPMFLKDSYLADDLEKDFTIKALVARFFQRYAFWFGFIELYNPKPSPFVNQEMRIRKTELLDSLIIQE